MSFLEGMQNLHEGKGKNGRRQAVLSLSCECSLVIALAKDDLPIASTAHPLSPSNGIAVALAAQKMSAVDPIAS